MEGVTRTLTSFPLAVVLAVVLAVTGPGIAVADPTPSPAPSASAAPSPTNGSRIGGTPGTPGPGKPGWVWWVGAAMVVAFGAGGVRFWRNRWMDGPPDQVDRDAGHTDHTGHVDYRD